MGASVAAGGSGPAMSRTPMDGRLCPPTNPPTATATALSWLNPSVMCICTSPVLLMTLGKRLPSDAGRTPPTVRRATENAG